MSGSGGPGVKKTRIGGLNLFFQAIRQHRWDDTLPGTAAFYPGDTPPVPEQVSRQLAEYVMTQVESPASLDRWPDPAGKLVTIILTRCGLRISSALSRDFACQIHDEHGRPVHLTPHHWRHTFACRLINRDVPQEVVRVLLDHDSHRMTSHYAKITDQTVRRRWEQATKVNINGERVTLDPDGPLAQAQWAKTRYGMATQTLPNGYCGLPVQKSCPHANACLTCPVFLTGPEFLPELHQQRRRTLTLIDVSAGKGHTRVAEMNQQVLANLDKMIGEIDKDQESEAADAS